MHDSYQKIVTDCFAAPKFVIRIGIEKLPFFLVKRGAIVCSFECIISIQTLKAEYYYFEKKIVLEVAFKNRRNVFAATEMKRKKNFGYKNNENLKKQ